jgi:signal transduction histidine kinase
MELVHERGPVERRRVLGRRREDHSPMRDAELCHDLRNPAAVIGLLAAAADLESDDRDAVRRRIRQIRAEARWLTLLLESSIRGDAPRLLDCRALVEECVEHVPVQGTVLEVSDAPGVPMVEAPAIGLRRAVTNVVNNAVRAAGPDGHVLVRVFSADGSVVVEVVDDGPGFGDIPTENGLGLRITEDVLVSIGGHVAVSPSVSGGSCVRLSLPAFAEAAESEPATP